MANEDATNFNVRSRKLNQIVRGHYTQHCPKREKLAKRIVAAEYKRERGKNTETEVEERD